MRVDTEKAEMIFSRLLEAYSLKEYPYDQPEATLPNAPENLPRMLKRGTREHALFLFGLCYWMRGGIKSHTAVKQLASLYDAYPEMFFPESSPKLVVSTLALRFCNGGLGFNASKIAEMWVENLAKIDTKWNGDPRTLLANLSTYEEACERIQNKRHKGFRGFQEKMVSMLIYFFMDAGLVDCFHFPIPVDFHVLRMIFAHEIIITQEDDANGKGFYTEPVLALVRELFRSYCIDHCANPLRLCDAVWMYSRLMCAKHPGNQSDVGGRHGRKTLLWPVTRWTPAQTRAFERTCGVCTIRETCRWCIPSAEYYIRGRIVPRERRDTPRQQNLFTSS